jgi:cobalamin synthase
MQRVRIGLTGLAFVFVAVLLAAALTSSPAGEAEITPNAIERQGAAASMSGAAPAHKQPAEPLAELGVAPGNADANSAAPANPPAR